MIMINKIMIVSILASVLVVAAFTALTPVWKATAVHNPSFISGGVGTGTVTTDSIADDSITNAKMADNAIGNAEMADNAIGNAEMADNAVNTVEMVDDAVTAAKLKPNSDAAAAIKFETNSVTTDTDVVATAGTFTPSVTSTAIVLVTADVTEGGVASLAIIDTVTVAGGGCAISGNGVAREEVVLTGRITLTQVVIITGCDTSNAKTITSTLTTAADSIAGDTINAHRIQVIWLPQ